MDIDQKVMKCSTCNKPLSVPPIYYNDSVGSICGRCSTIVLSQENDPFVRQRVFEDVSKYLFFPCSFQVFGCRAELKWGSVECHENICDYNSVVCPLSHEYFQKNCLWVDKHENLAEHIKRNHKNRFCSPPVAKITKKIENKILFFEITGRVVIIMLVFKSEWNKYFCCIAGDFPPEQCCLFQCQVSIFGDNYTKPSMLNHKGIQSLDAINFAKPEFSFQIDVDNLEHLFSTSEELTLKFIITKEVNHAKPELNEYLLSQLECPVCLEYMKPPIFICETGHNFCEVCTKKIGRCPICRQKLVGGRNFTLEVFTGAVNYPCVYKHFGCNFADLADKVKTHEQYCPHIGKKCFVEKCDWKGLHGDFLKHLQTQHPSKLYKQDTVCSYKLNAKKKIYVLLHNNDIFLLKICFQANEPLKFSLLYCEREATSYSYELVIMGCSPDIKIKLSNCCQAVPFHADIKTFTPKITSLPFDFISQFWLNYGKMEFKVIIKKNV